MIPPFKENHSNQNPIHLPITEIRSRGACSSRYKDLCPTRKRINFFNEEHIGILPTIQHSFIFKNYQQ